MPTITWPIAGAISLALVVVGSAAGPTVADAVTPEPTVDVTDEEMELIEQHCVLGLPTAADCHVRTADILGYDELRRSHGGPRTE